jgi:hypothetical protein
VIAMNIGDRLSREQKQNLNKLSKRKRKRKKKPKPKEERVDWIDIMGMNRDRYKRGKGGAIRRS